MRHGASLVPVCVFNERKAFTRLDPPAWLRNFGLRALRTPLLLIYGRWCVRGALCWEGAAAAGRCVQAGGGVTTSDSCLCMGVVCCVQY